MAPIRTLLFVSVFALISACGGGGGSSGTEQNNASGGPGTSSPGGSSGAGSGSGSSGGSGGGTDSGGNSGSGTSGGGTVTPDSPPTSGGSPGSDGGGNVGGGDSDGSGGNSGSGSGSSGGGDSGSGGGAETPTGDPDPEVPFAASVVNAPADGATISGTVRILIEGQGIENVELLPANGYAPLYARGVVTGDRIGAYIDFNTRGVPDGEIAVRVAAFSEPPGQGGREITAMAERTWRIENSAPPEFSAQLLSAPPTNRWLGEPPGGGWFAETVRFEVEGSNLGNVELVSAKDDSVIFGRFTISPDKTRATLDWNYRQYEGWSYGAYEVRILAWDAPPGEAGDQIEVMSMQRYYQKLPLGCQAEGRCGGEAP